MDNLIATHPSTENRIAALEEMSRHMGRSGFTGRGRTPDYESHVPATGPWFGAHGPWS
jgi:heat shock protein HtpX